MTIKTVRFNKMEEKMLKRVLTFYKKDFSGCVKDLICEKLEELDDVSAIGKICEGKASDYVTAKEIDKLF